MTDLVKRLRDEATFNFPICGEAADRIEELERELAEARKADGYLYFGKDGKAILARDLEDQRDAFATALADAAAAIGCEPDNEVVLESVGRLAAELEQAKRERDDAMEALTVADLSGAHDHKARADRLAAILHRVCEAADDVSSFAWSAVTADCNESAEYLNTVIRSLRAAIAEAKKEIAE